MAIIVYTGAHFVRRVDRWYFCNDAEPPREVSLHQVLSIHLDGGFAAAEFGRGTIACVSSLLYTRGDVQTTAADFGLVAATDELKKDDAADDTDQANKKVIDKYIALLEQMKTKRTAEQDATAASNGFRYQDTTAVLMLLQSLVAAAEDVSLSHTSVGNSDHTLSMAGRGLLSRKPFDHIVDEATDDIDCFRSDPDKLDELEVIQVKHTQVLPSLAFTNGNGKSVLYHLGVAMEYEDMLKEGRLTFRYSDLQLSTQEHLVFWRNQVDAIWRARKDSDTHETRCASLSTGMVTEMKTAILGLLDADSTDIGQRPKAVERRTKNTAARKFLDNDANLRAFLLSRREVQGPRWGDLNKNCLTAIHRFIDLTIPETSKKWLNSCSEEVVDQFLYDCYYVVKGELVNRSFESDSPATLQRIKRVRQRVHTCLETRKLLEARVDRWVKEFDSAAFKGEVSKSVAELLQFRKFVRKSDQVAAEAFLDVIKISCQPDLVRLLEPDNDDAASRAKLVTGWVSTMLQFCRFLPNSDRDERKRIKREQDHKRLECKEALEKLRAKPDLKLTPDERTLMANLRSAGAAAEASKIDLRKVNQKLLQRFFRGEKDVKSFVPSDPTPSSSSAALSRPTLDDDNASIATVVANSQSDALSTPDKSGVRTVHDVVVNSRAIIDRLENGLSEEQKTLLSQLRGNLNQIKAMVDVEKKESDEELQKEDRDEIQQSDEEWSEFEEEEIEIYSHESDHDEDDEYGGNEDHADALADVLMSFSDSNGSSERDKEA